MASKLKKTAKSRSPVKKLKQVIDPVVAKAFSHPLRGHVLATLGDRIASPREMAQELGIDARDLDYHVKVLVEIGMIRLVHTEKRRGAREHFYELQSPVLQLDDREWKRMPAQIRSSISATLLQVVMDDALEALRAGTFNARDSHQSRMAMILDEQGWHDVTTVMGGALERLAGIGEESKQRQQAGRGEAIPVEVYMMGFETAAGVLPGNAGSAEAA